MAAEDGVSGVKEPSPKIPRISKNGGDGHQPLLRVKKLSQNAVLPSRASALSAGYDLSSAVETKVPARGKALIPTDLSIAIPDGTYARIAPRSGLAWKHSIDVGAGVIDADYRGPVGVILFNHSDVDFEVKPGDRIAQMVLERIMTPDVAEVEDLDSTVRGVGGFGSTGDPQGTPPSERHSPTILDVLTLPAPPVAVQDPQDTPPSERRSLMISDLSIVLATPVAVKAPEPRADVVVPGQPSVPTSPRRRVDTTFGNYVSRRALAQRARREREKQGKEKRKEVMKPRSKETITTIGETSSHKRASSEAGVLLSSTSFGSPSRASLSQRARREREAKEKEKTYDGAVIEIRNLNRSPDSKS